MYCGYLQLFKDDNGRLLLWIPDQFRTDVHEEFVLSVNTRRGGVDKKATAIDVEAVIGIAEGRWTEPFKVFAEGP